MTDRVSREAVERHIKDRGDWLVDAVATSTQNRQFLRGEPECDELACDAIRMNGEKAMSAVAAPILAERDALLAERDRLREAGQAVVDRWDTPLWKEAKATGRVINRLRAALKGDQT